MAEVLCEGAEVASLTTSALCEASSIPATTRPIEIRRLKLLERTRSTGSETEPTSKRRKTRSSQVGRGEQSSCSLVGSDPNPVNPKEEDLDRLDAAVRCPRYGVTSVCGRRRDMEDAVSIRPDFVPNRHFFGVFDGHGCSHVATTCQERMHELVAEEWEKKIESKESQMTDTWTEVMKQSFDRMDGEAVNWTGEGRVPVCRCQQGRPMRSEHVGSTAVVAVVGPTRIIVSNCGDSRAVLSRNGVAVPLSSDHKPDRPDELERIQSAGGRVIYWDGPRVLGVLAMSRAIGDSHLKPFVMAEPEVSVTDREEGDECLILGSDGLWDVVTNEMACEVVRTCLQSNEPVRGEGEVGRASDKACSDAALLLTKLALARRSSDNVSVVVVDLRRNV
ncbi:Protein phosphatase 2C [Rhynchospora pubera]|uniref:protein-serine/threonine phosphatase n=1 Tax=Rhynchospora pubera TaxID=906938 RepID=A0AAV8HU51_9POAL|nr:Protein phosphatase 2C [Rhynchospora pubera]